MDNEEKLKIDFRRLMWDFQTIFLMLKTATACEENDETHPSREFLYEKGLELYDKWKPFLFKIIDETLNLTNNESSNGEINSEILKTLTDIAIYRRAYLEIEKEDSHE